MLPQYMDQLDPERRQVFLKLKAFSQEFVLGGGTAIMLQIGHRQSLDFDCFSEKELPRKILTEAKKIFGKNLFLQVATSEIVTIRTDKGVEISFVWHPFKLIRKTLKTDSISIFHLDDLVANKAYTIGRRGAWRDYIDLFFFLRWKKYSLKKTIKLAEKKFAGEFNEKLFLGQLTYFDDLEIFPTVFLKESYTPNQIKFFLGERVREYLKKVKKIS